MIEITQFTDKLEQLLFRSHMIQSTISFNGIEVYFT